MIFDLIALFIVGLLAGVISGLFGIGGGVVLVPTLFFILPYLHSFEKLMQTVIATSLSAMVLTTLFSFLLHLKAKNVNKKIALYIAPLTLLGCVLGSLTSHLISHKTLLLIFAIFLILISFKFFFNLKIKFKGKSYKMLFFAGGIIGYASSLLGIGGGVIALPLFASLNIPLKSAIGSSAFATFLTSFFGSISYAIIGQIENVKQFESFGYVYLPAFILVGVGMLIATPFGVKLTKILPIKSLQKVFALILFFTALNMIRNIF